MIGGLTEFAAACANKGISILPTWYQYLQQGTPDAYGHCSVQFTFPDDVTAVALAIVEILLRIAVVAAVVYVIRGGFLYMTSLGEPDKAASARRSIINAIAGLVISLIATGVVAFIGGQLAK